MPGGKTAKRLRKFMANQIQENPKNQQITMAQGSAMAGIMEAYSGPLPDPAMLVKYRDAGPDFPERIMRMAENHCKADITTKNRISLANLIIPIIGQLFTFVLGAGGIVACIYLAKLGFTGAAIAAIAGSFSPIIINAFRGLRQNRN